MATVYQVEIVSDWINYDEEILKELIEDTGIRVVSIKQLKTKDK